MTAETIKLLDSTIEKVSCIGDQILEESERTIIIKGLRQLKPSLVSITPGSHFDNSDDDEAFCARCETTIEEGDEHCRHCGRPLIWPADHLMDLGIDFGLDNLEHVSETSTMAIDDLDDDCF